MNRKGESIYCSPPFCFNLRSHDLVFVALSGKSQDLTRAYVLADFIVIDHALTVSISSGSGLLLSTPTMVAVHNERLLLG